MDTQTDQTLDARRPGKRGLFAVMAVIVLLTVAAVFVRDQFFRIREVEIYYVNRVSYDEVLALAGLSGESNYFDLNEEKIVNNINQNRYLECTGMERIWPDKVVLYINERAPRANVLHMGLKYTLAADGMTLERATSLDLDDGCVTVSGLNLRDIRVGSCAVCQQTAQLQAYIDVLAELDAQRFTQEISELNLSSLESIYLVTLDGYTVNLGDASDLRPKIGTVRAVVAELRARGYSGGTIEATVPGEASYRPLN